MEADYENDLQLHCLSNGNPLECPRNTLSKFSNRISGRGYFPSARNWTLGLKKIAFDVDPGYIGMPKHRSEPVIAFMPFDSNMDEAFIALTDKYWSSGYDYLFRLVASKVTSL